ncbi:hypothetical protein [Arthrobacter silvisoli]|uniref:hypothetical protein n=1 Tax=Arthrobacter silvisoli TaxID=2291022 RepID=UPI001FE75A41|nr:hypothetical protein [Arthrobacter silvisoli]
MLNKRLAVALTISGILVGASACAAPAQSADSSESAAPTAASAAGSTATGSADAGWDIDPADADQRIRAAGLDILKAEGAAEHYHAHLDVLVNGKPVAVPGGIGFSFGSDGQPNGISALHTHDTSGVVHIEAPTVGQKYTLGQVLKEWGVLDGTGATGAPHSGTGGWTAYVNGAKKGGPVAGVVLKAHDEVVLSYGTAPSTIPGSYTFPQGL